MKKLLSFMVAVIAIVCCAQTADAQQRTEVAKGVYLTTYGNVTVIENDNLQQSIQIRVEKSDNLYEISLWKHCGENCRQRSIDPRNHGSYSSKHSHTALGFSRSCKTHS